MKTVEVTTEEFKTIPGYSTTIDVAEWKGKIDALLYRLGSNPKSKIIKKAWLTEGSGPEAEETLLLEIKVAVGNVERHVSFKLEPVIMIRRINEHGKIRHIREEKASWKLFYELLDKKIAAARLGITELHYEFMPYITKQLPGGKTGTLSDVIDIVLEADRLNELGALEDHRDRRVVDSGAVVR